MGFIGADVRPPAVVASSTTASSRTRYTIDVDVHPDVASVALKHARQLPRFLKHYPISTHTREAYSLAVAFVNEFHLSLRNKDNRCKAADALRREEREGSKGNSEEALEGSEKEGGDCGIQKKNVKLKTRRRRHRLQVVLDSGCGTGRSTAMLARCYPHLPVLGVDRSAVRLARGANSENCKAAPSVMGCDNEEDDREALAEISSRPGKISGVTDCKRGMEHPPANLLLLRADLVDLWILASRDTAWEVVEHTILYPNPYPKRSQLRSRWHGHPVFPLILSLGGRITLRSNWKTYLDEVCLAVLAIASEHAVSGTEEIPASHQLHATTTSNANHGGATLETGGVYSAGRDKRDGAFQIKPWGGGRRDVAELKHTDTSPSIPDAVVAAAVSYTSSARRGPTPYMPIVPTTNFEAKYKAAGEKVYELKLDPRPSID